MKILKFNAVWCPGCLVQRPIWDEVLKEITTLDITEYDYDLDEEEVIKYNVGDKLPVVIMLDENNNEIKRLTGEKRKEEILSFLKER